MRFIPLLFFVFLLGWPLNAQIGIIPTRVSVEVGEPPARGIFALVTMGDAMKEATQKAANPTDGIQQYYDRYATIAETTLRKIAREQTEIKDEILTFDTFSEDEKQTYRIQVNQFYVAESFKKTDTKQAAYTRANVAPYANELAEKVDEDYLMMVSISGVHYVKKRDKGKAFPEDMKGSFAVYVSIYDGGSGLVVVREAKGFGPNFQTDGTIKSGVSELKEKRLIQLIEELSAKALRKFERRTD